MSQYGFYFDEGRCIQCRTCEVVCASVNNLEPGIRRIKIVQSWFGEFPDVRASLFPLVCLHCGKPACEEACPTGAISKRDEDGIIVVDRDNCIGCQDCFPACPFDVPQFGTDGTMQKCDLCLELDVEPACVVYCPTEALKYGLMEDLREQVRSKTAKTISDPTEPSIVVSQKRITSVLQDMPGK